MSQTFVGLSSCPVLIKSDSTTYAKENWTSFNSEGKSGFLSLINFLGAFQQNSFTANVNEAVEKLSLFFQPSERI